MTLKRDSVELLAPAGTWEALEAAVEAGADAVYLGGKHFNMRMHRNDTNFDDEMLKKAVEYTHSHGVRLYITINNLISREELPALREYLAYLNEIQPDAILVQDFAILQLVREMGITIPLHSSVMMNIHNAQAVEKLKEYGITRIVVGREMTLSELSLFRERTGIEVEYFMHGDMCISESGQCIHSGVLFGQSGNRGRCLKPCRWPYALIDEETGEVLDKDGPGPYKLALKDMCMYRSIPELIRAGVHSFKIEGRMRPADFVRRIVTVYRKAIDAYIEDPMGYRVDEEEWKQLHDNRVRDFTPTFAFGRPTAQDIGFTGEREPRFFSNAVVEPGFQDDILREERPIEKAASTILSVRVSTPEAAKAAIENGADLIYVGGETFLPLSPWRMKDYEEIIGFAREKGAKTVIRTPRTTTERECAELIDFLPAVEKLGPDGIQTGNLGTLVLTSKYTSLPMYADHSFNLFNPIAAEFLKENGIVMAAASLELSFEQLRSIVENTELPIEAVVHGAYESMICDHNIPAMSLPHYHFLDNPEIMKRHYALLDKAGEVHPIRMDQYDRNHIYFAKDLCLYPYLEKFKGLAAWRIEAQTYDEKLTGSVTKLYRQALDRLLEGATEFSKEELTAISSESPRKFGVGSYRFRRSRDSI